MPENSPVSFWQVPRRVRWIVRGRILLPSVLRDFAGLEKEVVLVGVGSRIEIWNKATWAEKNVYDDMEEIAENMEGLGI